MITLITLALVPAFAQDFEVKPAPLNWSALSEQTFDRTWTLPEKASGSRDLLAEMRKLCALQFSIDFGHGPQQGNLGDLVLKSDSLSKQGRNQWLNQLEQQAPRLMADWGIGLRELLLDDQLFADDWDPTESYQRDGLLIADDWELTSAAGAPWNRLKVDASFTQAAAIIRTDLATIKAVENDYRKYPDNIGAEYEEINPQRGQYFRGKDPVGNPFSTVAIEFECDLPFPYTTYECDLRILNRIDAEGIVRTDIYSTSSDFYYLAGRDVFLPIIATNEQQVGYLVVRHFGFDLRRVPDKSKHRLEGVRSSLGNLKRNAERLASQKARDSFTNSYRAITEFRVLGRD